MKEYHVRRQSPMDEEREKRVVMILLMLLNIDHQLLIAKVNFHYD
jgi:hypothetical protein